MDNTLKTVGEFVLAAIIGAAIAYGTKNTIESAIGGAGLFALFWALFR